MKILLIKQQNDLCIIYYIIHKSFCFIMVLAFHPRGTNFYTLNKINNVKIFGLPKFIKHLYDMQNCVQQNLYINYVITDNC